MRKIPSQPGTWQHGRLWGMVAKTLKSRLLHAIIYRILLLR